MSGSLLKVLSQKGQVDYFCEPAWGRHYGDDKYFGNEELEDNFIVFYTYAYAYLNLPRPTRSQYEMALFVADRSNPHRLLMAQRGLAKSLTSQIYVVWRFLNDPHENILIMSAGRTRAGNYSKFVQNMLRLLPVTRHLYPRHNIERTSGESFDVAGSTISDSPSMFAVGSKSQVTGFRATLIIYDDIETAQTVQSAVMSEAIDTFAMEAQNLLISGKDESITLCTPHSMSSIYINWIDEKGFVPFVVPALYPESGANYFGGLAPFIMERVEADPSLIGTAIDERQNMEFLMSKKMRIGNSKFKLQYQIDVSDADDLRYPLKLSDFIVADIDIDEAPLKISYSSMPENIIYQKHNGFVKDKLYKAGFSSNEFGKYDYKVLSVDPSGRGKDEIGLSMIFHLNSKLFLKKVIGLQGGYEDENLTYIAQLCSDYGINAIAIEGNWGDGMFLKVLEPYLIRISPLTEIVEVKVKGQKEVRIIENLEPLLNQHRIVIDKELFDHDLNAVKRDYSFTHQLSHITPERESLRHDDRLDSLAIGVQHMIEWMSDSEDIGYERHVEAEAQKTLDFTLQMFNGQSRRKTRPNFASRF